MMFLFHARYHDDIETLGYVLSTVHPWQSIFSSVCDIRVYLIKVEDSQVVLQVWEYVNFYGSNCTSSIAEKIYTVQSSKITQNVEK
jgi:hypothetical protein